MKGVTIILITIIGIMTSVNYYIKNKDVVKVKSTIDGREYRIAEAPDQQEVADLLGKINTDVLKLIDQYRDDLKSSEDAIAHSKNTVIYQTIGLNKKITDDPEMLSFVNRSLSKCKALKPQVKDLKKTKIDHSGHNH